jgi:hypothetical protein
MDGPDVKPLWKRWLGSKLESYASKLKPIDYCNRHECKFFQQGFAPTRLIAVEHKIGEDELMQAMRDEQFAKHSRYRYPLPKSRTVDGLVENAKREIVRSLLSTAESYINIEVRKEECFPTIYVYGSMYVGKNKSINIKSL